MSNDSTAGCPKCAGLAACWCPPLSPIALDWRKAHADAHAAYLPSEFDTGGEYDALLEDALQRQLPALVARVAQEEREKVFAEVMAEWTKPTIRTHAEAYQYVSDFTCWLQGRLTDV